MIDTVPLGEAGTGAAYILPQGSQAADRLLDTIDYNQKIAQQNEQNKQAAAQAMAQSYKDNAFKAKNGLLWNNELQALQQKHIQQGADYAKQGIDIYNPNPNDPAQQAASQQYLADRAKLYDLQDNRAEIAKAFDEDQQTLAKAPAGKYDSKSIQAQHDFINNNTLQGVVNGGLQLPRVREAFDPEATIYSKAEPVMSGVQEFEKNGHRITTNAFMKKATRANGETMLQSVPGASDWVQQQTGLPIAQIKQLPDKLQDIQDYNDRQFRMTPQGQKALVDAGITSYSDPRYQQILAQKSQSDLIAKQKYNNILDTYQNRARANAKPEDRNVPDWEGLKYNDEKNKEKQNETAPAVYNTPDNAAVGQSGSGAPNIVNGKQKNPEIVTQRPSTSLISFDVGSIKGNLTPNHIYNTDTGDASANSSALHLTGNQLKLKPVLEYSTPKGTFRRILTDDQVADIKNGTWTSNSGSQKIKPTASDIKYQYMLYGQQSLGKGQYKNVAVPWDESLNKNVEKKVNFDEAESKLSPDVRIKLANDRISRLYPQLQGQQKVEAIKEYMQAVDQQYNQ